MIRVIGPKNKRDPNTINTTSRSNNWTRGLSPFYLGPVYLYGYYTASNVENAWQFCKVYPEHIASDNYPTDEYWKWARAGWADKKAHRYPMGKGAIPLYSFWNGARLTYIQARKIIYAPIYRDAVIETDVFKRLKGMYESQDIVLWDFDGYDHHSLGMTYKDVINDPTRKMGHAFVLAMILDGKLEELIKI